MICVNCGTEVASVYQEYSKGNIRLTRCGSCNQYADPYVEYELMVVFIDLVLHKRKAYSHVLHNRLPKERGVRQRLLWDLVLVLVLLDCCKLPLLGLELPRDGAHDELAFYCKLAAKTTAINVAYMAAASLSALVLCRPSSIRCSDITLALAISSFFKLLIAAMMVWEFSPVMGFLIDVFTVSSNAAALQALLRVDKVRAAVAVSIGSCVKTLAEMALSLDSGLGRPPLIFG